MRDGTGELTYEAYRAFSPLLKNIVTTTLTSVKSMKWVIVIARIGSTSEKAAVHLQCHRP